MDSPGTSQARAKRENPDFAVREIEAAAPRLRRDLRWTFQEVRGEGTYLLEDPVQGKFYRLGRREHEFATELDGRRTVAALVAASAKRDPRLALESGEAASLVRLLVDAGLVETGGASHADRVWDEVNRPRESKKALGRVGQMLFLKLPLGNPDRFFDWLARKAGWLAGPWFAAVWVAVVTSGAAAVHGEKERFVAQLSGLFDFGNLWILGGLWLVLKAFHECWHGFVCRRFGGAVPEAGITLLLFTTPLGYVNASSSASFPSRWHRIAVAAAGIYGELLLSALAAILWARTEPGPLSEALHRIVVLSSATTLLFNANPLMRFDGYYLLSDLLDIPNLYVKGQGVVGWFLRRHVLGMRKAAFPLRRSDPSAVIAVYGAAAWVWKGVVLAGILVALAVLFEGAGILLCFVVLAAMVAQGAAAAADYLRKSAASEGLRPARLVARMVVLSGIAAFALFMIEVAPVAKAPAVVRDAGGGEVRAGCPGFLVELAVRTGDRVAEGDLLARLENVEETSRLARLETEIAASRLRRDALVESGEIAASQAEEEHLAGLEASASEMRGHVSSLALRAPRGGTVDGRHLELLLGTWIETGRSLFSVVEGNRRELVILADADAREPFEQARAAERPVLFHPRGRWRSWAAGLEESIPKAALEPAHFALIAPAGGPLPVRQRNGADREPGAAEEMREEVSRFELTAPRFEFRASLAEGAGLLREGEIGFVTARANESSTLAELAWELGRKSLEGLLARSKAG